jgi:hypothetical protein
MGQKLRSISSVPVQQNNDMESLLDEVAVACLLIPAISKILACFRTLSFGRFVRAWMPTASSKVESGLASSNTTTCATLRQTLGVIRFRTVPSVVCALCR